MQIKAAALVSEGYLPALVGSFDELAEYWEGMLRDFPGHPVRDHDPELRSSIGCTLYGDFVAIFPLPNADYQGFWGLVAQGFQCCSPHALDSGDEVDCHGDSWMFLLWSSDTSPVSTHSPSSRWPICILPASKYAYAGDVNITLQAVTQAITASFNRLSIDGIPVLDLPSLGGRVVVLVSFSFAFCVFLFCRVDPHIFLGCLFAMCFVSFE